MGCKLLALDMDGTLLDGNKEISPENRRWIRKARESGVAVCLATGRGRHTLMPYYRELELDGYPFVAVNGGEVWRDGETLVSRKSLDPSLNRRFLDVAAASGAWYWAYGPDGYLTKDNWKSGFETEQWQKFGFYTEDRDALAWIVQQVSAMGPLELSNSDPNNVEVNPPGVTKASGLREVCRILGCRMEETIAIGDSLNDLAMIREAGLGIAMGNAQETVRQAADEIVANNEEDGVAMAIRRFIFGEA